MVIKNGPTVKVGDRVRLNIFGLEQVFGSAIGLSHMRRRVMTITWVSEESMTEPEETYPVEVDDPEINRFLIDDVCFDKVEI